MSKLALIRARIAAVSTGALEGVERGNDVERLHRKARSRVEKQVAGVWFQVAGFDSILENALATAAEDAEMFAAAGGVDSLAGVNDETGEVN